MVQEMNVRTSLRLLLIIGMLMSAIFALRGFSLAQQLQKQAVEPLAFLAVPILEFHTYHSDWLRYKNLDETGVAKLAIEDVSEFPFAHVISAARLRMNNFEEAAAFVQEDLAYDEERIVGRCDSEKLRGKSADVFCVPGTRDLPPGQVFLVLYHPETFEIVALTTTIDNRANVATRADWSQTPEPVQQQLNERQQQQQQQLNEQQQQQRQQLNEQQQQQQQQLNEQQQQQQQRFNEQQRQLEEKQQQLNQQQGQQLDEEQQAELRRQQQLLEQQQAELRRQQQLEEQQRQEKQRQLEEQQRREQQQLEEQQRQEKQRQLEEQQRREQQQLEEQQRQEKQRQLEEQQRQEKQRQLEEQQRQEKQRQEEQQNQEQQQENQGAQGDQSAQPTQDPSLPINVDKKDGVTTYTYSDGSKLKTCSPWNEDGTPRSGGCS